VFPPFSKRGVWGDFILLRTPSNQYIFMTSAMKEDVLRFGENSIPPNSLNFMTELNKRVQIVKG
jgi:hypothetical protein